MQNFIIASSAQLSENESLVILIALNTSNWKERENITRSIRRRDWHPSVYFHVTMRGNNRENIYEDEQDKYHLMRCFGEAHQRFDFTIIAFCIMSNHYHILIQSKDELSKIMARVNRRYSDYYSKRYHHVGRIYQRRYYAKAIVNPYVLLIVSRYIHRNPIETQIPMVTDLSEYPHSSYPSYRNPPHVSLPYLNTSILPQFLSNPFSIDAEGYCEYCLKVNLADDEFIEEWL
ncbi:transposase [Sporosarcina sp. CAU 1771]